MLQSWLCDTKDSVRTNRAGTKTCAGTYLVALVTCRQI